jgi:hypothetical protein
MPAPTVRPAIFSRLGLALIAAVACLLALPALSRAANRYASPGGNEGTENCLNAEHPCSLSAVLQPQNSTNGDTILLAPGTYQEIMGGLEIPHAVTVAGEPGKERPLLRGSGAVGSLGLFSHEPVTLRDLRIESPANTSRGIELTGGLGTTVERVESTGKAAIACYVRAGYVRNSLCAATPGGENGIGFESSLTSARPESVPVNLSGVTAIGGTAGIEAAGGNEGGVFVYANNTIARGERWDILTNAAGETAGASVHLSHSNYEVVEGTGNGFSSVTPVTEAGNQSADPVFVDPTAGNYRELASSPTHLAGDRGLAVGEFDLDLRPRTTTCAGTVFLDIGAYQLAECPRPEEPETPEEHETPGGGNGGGGSDSGGGSGGGSSTGSSSPGSTSGASTTPPPAAPRLSGLTLKPRRFALAGKPPKGAARGTTIAFILSAPASVRLEVLARRTAKGKKPRLVTLGRLTNAGKAGANKVVFNGRLKGKALAPGTYTLRAVAAGSTATTTFTVTAVRTR